MISPKSPSLIGLALSVSPSLSLSFFSASVAAPSTCRLLRQQRDGLGCTLTSPASRLAGTNAGFCLQNTNVSLVVFQREECGGHAGKMYTRIKKKKEKKCALYRPQKQSSKPAWSFNCPSAAPYIPDTGQTGFYNVVNFRVAKTLLLEVTAAEKKKKQPPIPTRQTHKSPCIYSIVLARVSFLRVCANSGGAGSSSEINSSPVPPLKRTVRFTPGAHIHY